MAASRATVTSAKRVVITRSGVLLKVIVVLLVFSCLLCHAKASNTLDDNNNSHRINNLLSSHRGAARSIKLTGSGIIPSGTDGVVVLGESPECAEDLKRICSPGLLQNNFAVLDCVQNHKMATDGLFTRTPTVKSWLSVSVDSVVRI